MTTRKVFAHGDVRILGPEEAISREEALRLYTLGSAETCFMEDSVGSIEPGKLADVAVLSADPLTVAEDELRDVRACLTIVGGKIVHRDGV
jgi:predicted amidohydrolase YtcJ